MMAAAKSKQKVIGAVAAVCGAVLVVMQLSGHTHDSEGLEKMPEEVRKSKLKHALASGGLYPIPVKEGSRIKPTPSGSMAVFSSGDSDAALSKGGGDPM